MIPIDWPPIIRALVASGLTQPKIAEACSCGQSTISDMLLGKTSDPRTSTGLLVLGLAQARGVPVPNWRVSPVAPVNVVVASNAA